MMSRKLSVLFSSAKQINATIAIVVGLFLVAGGWAYGQDVRASLGGRVTDPQGAIIPNATVTVTADETGVVQTTNTNSSGDWIVLTLLPGHYHFEVKAPGFKTEERTSIELQVGDKKYVDTQMQVGNVSQSVTVEATTPLIDLTSSASGSVVTLAELEEIPTQSNAPTMDESFLPGVTVSLGVGGGVFLWSGSALSSTTVNGTGGSSLPGALSYTLDGGSVNYNSSGSQANMGRLAFEPPMDSVNELKMVTNGYDASLGRGSAANVMLSFKSGAVKFHGDLYETWQGTALNANSFQNDALGKAQAPIHTHEYGGSGGGPVWIPKIYDGRKMKTFFYFSYAGIRNIGPEDFTLATVPSLLERKGDFSQSYNVVSGVKYPVQLYNPYSSTTGSRVPFSCSTYGTMAPVTNTCEAIPSGNSVTTAGATVPNMDPIAQAYYSMMPAPDVPTDNAVSSDSDNFQKIAVQSDKFHGYTLRVDQTENNKNHTYVDLYYNTFNELSYTGFGTAVTTTATAAGLTTGNPLPIQGRYQVRTNKGLTLDHDITLNERLLLDLNYHAMSYFSAPTHAPGLGIDPTTVGFSSTFAGQMQIPTIPEVTGFTSSFATGAMGTDGNGGVNAPLDVNQDMNASITQTYKNHNFHYGWEYMIQQEGNSTLATPGGVFAFPAVGANGNYTSKCGVSVTGCTTSGSGWGSPIADFYMGLAGTGSTMPISASSFFSQHYTAFYFQDDWRYTPKLTLNLGLRWDYERPTTERFNRFFSQYNPTAPQTAATAASEPTYATDQAGTSAGSVLLQTWGVQPGAFKVIGGPEYAGVNGTSRYETAPRYKYFQPRIGFAYQLMPNTVIRGGLGRFVQADFSPSFNQTGYSQSTSYCPGACLNYLGVGQTWDNPYPAGLVQPIGNSSGLQTNIGSVGLSTFTNFNIGRIYVDTATLGVQRQIKDYLFEVTGLFNATHGLALSIPINTPSAGAWYAANTPSFATSGAVVTTLPGNVTLTNPFKGVANINATLAAASTVSAYQLLRPNPTSGDLYLNSGDGKVFYYALNTKVEKRFNNGFSVLQTFSYSKQISENNIYNQNGSQAVAVKIEKRLATGDQRFHYQIAPIYELPFGRGKRFLNNDGYIVEELVGGWEFSGIYNFQSGVPVVFPTNSALFQGTDPKPVGQKSHSNWFDTTKFAAFPTSSVSKATLANTTIYPAWTGVTGMPGYSYSPASGNNIYNDFATWNTYFPTTFGDIRQPYTTAFTLGARKSFVIAGPVRFQVRMDVFNALNHPLFASVNVTPTSTYFGTLSSGALESQTNSPRQVQLSGKLFF
jgi:hypothetical protein